MSRTTRRVMDLYNALMHPDLIESLSRMRQDYCFPAGLIERSERFRRLTLGLLVPHLALVPNRDPEALRRELHEIQESMPELISDICKGLSVVADPSWITEQFLYSFPALLDLLEADAAAMADGDPAATGVDEVKLAYPGFLAIATYRIAHQLYSLNCPLLPRLLTEAAHRDTGVDIHPGATIGRSFCIDHGTGVVIGESAVIGNGVKLYQGVTLGALAVAKALASTKRHPTIGDNTVIYANATVLGGNTVIGSDCIIGANAWVTKSVPSFSFVGRDAEFRSRKEIQGTDLEYFI